MIGTPKARRIRSVSRFGERRHGAAKRRGPGFRSKQKKRGPIPFRTRACGGERHHELQKRYRYRTTTHFPLAFKTSVPLRASTT